MESVSFQPIGHFRSAKIKPYQAARQASAAQTDLLDYVELDQKKIPLSCLRNLNEFSHIWLIYVFDNPHWNPLVSPPRGTIKKVGVFASRSPYRPNPIGISAVELVQVNEHKIFVGANDLLDKTLILDIKPYLPYADSLSANHGWLENIENEKFEIHFSDQFLDQMKFFDLTFSQILMSFIQQQLEFQPLNKQKKRLKLINSSTGLLCYQTWRILFTIENHRVFVQAISSGYSLDEMSSQQDPYQDKDLHRKFFQAFPS